MHHVNYAKKSMHHIKYARKSVNYIKNYFKKLFYARSVCFALKVGESKSVDSI